MVNKKGCCEDKHVVVKTEKKHSLPVLPDLVPKPILQPVTCYYTVLQAVVRIPALVSYTSSGSPPGNGHVPLFIRHCMYRI